MQESAFSQMYDFVSSFRNKRNKPITILEKMTEDMARGVISNIQGGIWWTMLGDWVGWRGDRRLFMVGDESGGLCNGC